MINFPMDESVVLSKEGSLANSKNTWGQVLTPHGARLPGWIVAWPGLAPVQPTCSYYAGPWGNLVTNESVCLVGNSREGWGLWPIADPVPYLEGRRFPKAVLQKWGRRMARFSCLGEKAGYVEFHMTLLMSKSQPPIFLNVKCFGKKISCTSSTLPSPDFRLVAWTPRTPPLQRRLGAERSGQPTVPFTSWHQSQQWHE